MNTKWVRIIAMAAAFVAAVVLEAVPCTAVELEWASLIAMVAAFVLAAWNAWKNNDFTAAAKVGTEVMQAIKDGKITVEEVKEILGSIDE